MDYFFEKLRSKSFLRKIVLIKLLALFCIWIALDRGFTFGDKILTAASKDETKPEAAATTPAEGAKPEAATLKPGDGTTLASAEKGAPDGKTEPPKPRRSFLANLLDLPDLDPDGLKKEEINRYLEIADRKKRQISDRLDILQRREDQLTGLEASIDDKLKRLDEERKYLAQTIQKEKDLKGERLDKLITLYAKMEPKKAAAVFEKLDKDLVVELFKQIPQKQITVILEGMPPAKSVEVTEYFGRVRSAKEYDLLKEMNQSLRKEFEECKGMPPESAMPQAAAKAEAAAATGKPSAP